MSVDAEVQAMIDASLLPLARALGEQRVTINELTERVATLEATTQPGNVGPWKQIFFDDFPTDVPLGQFPAAVSSKWGAYPTSYKDTSKNGTYDPAKTISIVGGVMKIHMFTDATGVVRVAAPVPFIKPPTTTMKWPGQLYGRYAIRARFVNLAPGFKVAWLLWPDSGTNTQHYENGVLVPGGNGEIDYAEHGLDQRARTNAYMHRQDATVGNDQYSCSVATDLSQWHTFVTEWSPNLCRFLLDGVEIGKTTDRVPNTSMHWVIQCETQLSGGKPAASVVADIEVDSVTVWAYAP